MKFFDEKKLFHVDTATKDPAIIRADEGCRKDLQTDAPGAASISNAEKSQVFMGEPHFLQNALSEVTTVPQFSHRTSPSKLRRYCRQSFSRSMYAAI